MASNSFGKHFRITTWGESHGPAIGVVIDGCPAGLPLNIEEIQVDLDRRKPGKNSHVSPRKEQDLAQLLSGVFEGKTTGAPIAILIPNEDGNPSQYETLKEVLRPGHANFTYLQKYGIFDYRGGGRASARETASRVAAGAIAKKLLSYYEITLLTYLKEAGGIETKIDLAEPQKMQERIWANPLFCPDPVAAKQIEEKIQHVKEQGDSLGGIVEFIALSLPVGLGDPIYEKLEANLAHAMLSIPASKGIEFGAGFQAARMKGSEHNDRFILDEHECIKTESNHAGGTLGGISTGMPLVLRVPFKPTSTILQDQPTLTLEGKATHFIPKGGRHDPCLAIRAVPVVEAMGAITLIDSLLGNCLINLQKLNTKLLIS